MTENKAREQLLHFLDKRAFDPVLDACSALPPATSVGKPNAFSSFCTSFAAFELTALYDS